MNGFYVTKYVKIIVGRFYWGTHIPSGTDLKLNEVLADYIIANGDGIEVDENGAPV